MTPGDGLYSRKWRCGSEQFIDAWWTRKKPFARTREGGRHRRHSPSVITVVNRTVVYSGWNQMQAPVRPRLNRPPNTGGGHGGLLWRPQQPVITRAGQGPPVPLELNRQARPVNVRSAPLNASSALPVRGSGAGALPHSRSFQIASSGTSVATSAACGSTPNNDPYFPTRAVATPTGSFGRGARPKVRHKRTASARRTMKTQLWLPAASCRTSTRRPCFCLNLARSDDLSRQTYGCQAVPVFWAVS